MFQNNFKYKSINWYIINNHTIYFKLFHGTESMCTNLYQENKNILCVVFVCEGIMLT